MYVFDSIMLAIMTFLVGIWIGGQLFLTDNANLQAKTDKYKVALQTIRLTGEIATIDDFETCKMRVRFMTETATTPLTEKE